MNASNERQLFRAYRLDQKQRRLNWLGAVENPKSNLAEEPGQRYPLGMLCLSSEGCLGWKPGYRGLQLTSEGEEEQIHRVRLRWRRD